MYPNCTMLSFLHVVFTYYKGKVSMFDCCDVLITDNVAMPKRGHVHVPPPLAKCPIKLDIIGHLPRGST